MGNTACRLTPGMLQVRHTEVEEIGVEHLLKDVKDATISTLSTEVAGKAQVRSAQDPYCVWPRRLRLVCTPCSLVSSLRTTNLLSVRW